MVEIDRRGPIRNFLLFHPRTKFETKTKIQRKGKKSLEADLRRKESGPHLGKTDEKSSDLPRAFVGMRCSFPRGKVNYV